MFQLLLNTQRAGFELTFEILTSGVERLARFLEDVLDSAFGVFEVLYFAPLSKFLLWISSASPATRPHLVQ